ncbi:putative Cyclic nucleotide-binding domain-containing protein [Gammaproteobacteria bacterium]
MTALIEKLRAIPLLDNIETDRLTEIAAICSERQLVPGETLTAEGTADYNLYVVSNGSVEVAINSRPGSSEPPLCKEFMVGEGQYELIGEVNWLKRQYRTATVKCIDAVDIIQIEGVALWELLAANPEVGMRILYNIALILADRLKDADLTLRQFSFG